jgi:hypothetical protein
LESEYNIERVLGTACAVTKLPLLLRADSGFCSQHLISRSLEQAAAVGRQVDLLIKWNPRTAPVEKIAAQRCADKATVWTQLREGKRECLWSEAPMATPNCPTCGRSNCSRQDRWDYDDCGLMAMRAAASLRR